MTFQTIRRPWLWAPAVLAADFVTKRLVLANADVLAADRVEVLGNVFRLSYVRNAGAAMGIFHGGRPFLIGISVLASLVLILLYRRTSPELRLRRAASAAVLGGALGNLVDRAFYDGRVVDFLDFGIGSHRFYTFNIADVAVTVGGVILFLSLWMSSGSRSEADAGPGTAAASAAAAPAAAAPAAADNPPAATGSTSAAAGTPPRNHD